MRDDLRPGDLVRRTSEVIERCRKYRIGIEGLEVIGQVRETHGEYVVVKWDNQPNPQWVKRCLVESAYD